MQKAQQALIHDIINMLQDDLNTATDDKFECLKSLNYGDPNHKKLRVRIEMLNLDIDYLNFQIKDLSNII